MELIDTHAHLTFDDLADDVDAVLERSIAAGVTEWITVGTDREHLDRLDPACASARLALGVDLEGHLLRRLAQLGRFPRA